LAVFFVLANPPVSEFYALTFRNTQFRLRSWCKQEDAYSTYEDGTGRVFRSFVI